MEMREMFELTCERIIDPGEGARIAESCDWSLWCDNGLSEDDSQWECDTLFHAKEGTVYPKEAKLPSSIKDRRAKDELYVLRREGNRSTLEASVSGSDGGTVFFMVDATIAREWARHNFPTLHDGISLDAARLNSKQEVVVAKLGRREPLSESEREVAKELSSRPRQPWLVVAVCALDNDGNAHEADYGLTATGYKYYEQLGL